MSSTKARHSTTRRRSSRFATSLLTSPRRGKLKRCHRACAPLGAASLLASLGFFEPVLFGSLLFASALPVSFLPAAPFAGGDGGGVGETSGAASGAPAVSGRGQEKLSARPGGAAIASPRLRTCVASGSDSCCAG